MPDFKIIEDADECEFCIETPDGEQNDWVADDEIAVVEYDGTQYLATNCGNFAGMKPGVVYTLGAAQTTQVVDYEPDEDDHDDIEDLDVLDEDAESDFDRF